MERILKRTARNRFSIMFTLPVYREERTDLMRKLERNGYGIPKEKPITLNEYMLEGGRGFLALAAVALLAVFLIII